MKKTSSLRTTAIFAVVALLAFFVARAGFDALRNRESAPLDEDAATPLDFATQFSIVRRPDGVATLRVADGREYALVPEDATPSARELDGRTVLRIPLERVYLGGAASADMVARLDALDRVACCGSPAREFASEKTRAAVESGAIKYAGKYSAPEYETLFDRRCDAAIESTMIYHAPRVLEQLERLEIPVLVERSNYESHPLGRLEWIKLYGILFGKESEANAFFEREKEKIAALTAALPEVERSARKRVAFFYVSSNGYVNVRKPGDYLCKMIELAGGRYALDDAPFEASAVGALSTISVDWETFYQRAVDADVLIYNGSIGGGIASIDELLAKNPIFKDFKAVKSGDVWNSGFDLYQESSAIADAILDFKTAIDGESGSPTKFLTKLE